MWWHDISEMKVWLKELDSKFNMLQSRMDLFMEDHPAVAEDRLCDKLDSIFERINKLDKDIPFLASLVNPENIIQNYDEHVNKINNMLLELKGCISLARSAVAERKEQQKDFDELKETTKIAQQIYKSMQNFIDAGSTIEKQRYFKIDAIYRAICEKEEKPKKKTRAKKKPNPSP